MIQILDRHSANPLEVRAGQLNHSEMKSSQSRIQWSHKLITREATVDLVVLIDQVADQHIGYHRKQRFSYLPNLVIDLRLISEGRS